MAILMTISITFCYFRAAPLLSGWFFGGLWALDAQIAGDFTSNPLAMWNHCDFSCLFSQMRKNHPKKHPPKMKKFIGTSFSQLFLLGSWLTSQEGFEKYLCKRDVFLWYFWILGGRWASSFHRFRPWTGKSCFSNRALVKTIFEALKCLSK